LFDLCRKETVNYFPDDREIVDIYDEYIDQRAGHFTTQTHQTLAELISKSLDPGLFKTDYKNFREPIEPFKNIFIKIK
jgi:hypothetical protein